jgi:hypothetical protein
MQETDWESRSAFGALANLDDLAGKPVDLMDTGAAVAAIAQEQETHDAEAQEEKAGRCYDSENFVHTFVPFHFAGPIA